MILVLFWRKTILLILQFISGRKLHSQEKKLPGGMYLVVLPNQQYFDIVISEQHFSFTTHIISIEKMKFENSQENLHSMSI